MAFLPAVGWSSETVDPRCKNNKGDACIIATHITMEDLKESFLTCADNRVNAISTCKEALYPWNSSPDLTKEIGNYNSLNSDEIKDLVERGDYIPSYMWNQNGWLCSKLGLTISSQTQKCIPHICKEDMNSSTLGMTIKAGHATGMSAIVTTETEEGITLETECIGKVNTEGEFDMNEWPLYGEPDTTIVVKNPATVELTCATIVNRLPHLIDSEPVYITT